MGVGGVGNLHMAVAGGSPATVTLNTSGGYVTGYTMNGGSAVSVSPPVPLAEFLQNPPASLANQTCTVSGTVSQQYTLGVGDLRPAVPGTVPNVILTRDASGKISSYTSPDGTSHPLSPPATLADFIEAVRSATPGTALAALKGQSYAYSGMTATSNLSLANVVLLTSGGNSPTVTGYTLNGQVFQTLPSDFAGLSPSAFAAKVQTMTSGPMAALQGLSYASSSNSISSTSGTSIYVNGGNGTTMFVHAYADPAHPGQNIQLNPPVPLTTFLDQIQRAPSGSPLASLAGVTFNPVEVTFSAQGGVINMISHIAGQEQVVAMENPPPPSNNVPANLYMIPSMSADLAVLLMMVAALKSKASSLENQAILNMMQNTIAVAQYQISAISTKNDAEQAESIATIGACFIQMGAAMSALGMFRDTKNVYNKSLHEKQQAPQVTAASTTAVPPGAPASAAAAAPQAAVVPPLTQDDYKRANQDARMNNKLASYIEGAGHNLSRLVTESAKVATNEAKSQSDQVKVLLENCQQLNHTLLGLLVKDSEETQKSFQSALQTVQQLSSDYTRYTGALMRSN